MTESRPPSERETIAWLLYCYQQGYTDPSDRAVLSNWIANPPEVLHPDDRKLRESLLAMADEIRADQSVAGSVDGSS